jgi:hypothetical protein
MWLFKCVHFQSCIFHDVLGVATTISSPHGSPAPTLRAAAAATVGGHGSHCFFQLCEVRWLDHWGDTRKPYQSAGVIWDLSSWRPVFETSLNNYWIWEGPFLPPYEQNLNVNVIRSGWVWDSQGGDSEKRCLLEYDPCTLVKDYLRFRNTMLPSSGQT